MNSPLKKLSSAVLLGFALSVPFIQGCTTAQDPGVSAAVEDKQFYSWFNNLTDQIKADPKYKRIPIDTKAQSNEFLVWLHDAYRKKITKHEFTQRVNSTYPNHEYETSFIVSRLP